MASVREALGVSLSLSSKALVTAKVKPLARASASARLSGTGQGVSGVLSTMNRPKSASAKRMSAIGLGFSSSSHHAMSTDQAGIR
jgi:hypothetical protein